jgi:hypothetical protein
MDAIRAQRFEVKRLIGQEQAIRVCDRSCGSPHRESYFKLISEKVFFNMTNQQQQGDQKQDGQQQGGGGQSPGQQTQKPGEGGQQNQEKPDQQSQK